VVVVETGLVVVVVETGLVVVVVETGLVVVVEVGEVIVGGVGIEVEGNEGGLQGAIG